MSVSDNIEIFQVNADDNPGPTAIEFSDVSQGATIRALADNSDEVWLVTADDGDDTTGFPLAPGEALALDFANLGQALWVYGADTDAVAVVVVY